MSIIQDAFSENLTGCVTPTTYRSGGATVINLAQNPYDLKPAVCGISTTVREILAQNRKAIILLGEDHNTTAQVRMVEALRQTLQNQHQVCTSIALEFPYNFANTFIDFLYPEESIEVKDIFDKLDYFSKERQQVNALISASLFSNNSPLTLLQNGYSFLTNSTPVFFMDLAKVDQICDFEDEVTRYFISTHDAEFQTHQIVDITSRSGMRLRNLFMCENILKIMEKEDQSCLIVDTGSMHITGNNDDLPYEETLKNFLDDTKSDDLEIVTVFQECEAYNLSSLSKTAKTAFSGPNNFIIRGGCDFMHKNSMFGFGSFEKEIEILDRINKETLLSASLDLNATGSDEESIMKNSESFVFQNIRKLGLKLEEVAGISADFSCIPK